jgi:hypothetical protein
MFDVFDELADALVSLCKVGLAHAEVGPGRRDPPQLSGIVAFEALERRGGPALAVTAALWRALVVRDGGCTHPGCDRPPGWCEAHHIEHWADGGTTTLDNLRLYCDRHHHDAHRLDTGPDPPGNA